MKQRVFYLLKFYLATVFFFIVAKIVFILYNLSNEDISFFDVVQVLYHGLSLDLSFSLYLLAAPFLLVIASLWFGIPKWVFRIYYIIAAILLSMAFVADTSLYEFWKFKLDASCLSYLETPTEAMASVTTSYILIRLLWVVLCSTAIYWIYDKLTPHSLEVKLTANRHKLIATIIAILLIPLIVIGIRGGLSESTTNIGQVYYSQNQFLNHSAVNPVFSFLASFENTVSDVTLYNFYSEPELRQLTKSLYNCESETSDTLLTTNRPNVVVILLESCGSMFLDVMPNLRQAAIEGIDFTNCYGNSYRTDRGTVSSLSGYLSFPTMSVMKMSNKVGYLPSIARSLQREGYSTEYLYGGDINFTKMKGYLISTGFQQLHWKQDYTLEEQASSKWGVRDDITFKTLSQLIRQHDVGKPFLIGYSTLSSHEPWDVPVSKYKERQYNGFSYVDDCIGEFLRSMKQSKQWDNLLIVFMPDHSSDFNDYNEQHPDRNHIPMIWTGGAVKQPRKLNMICNQSDFAATLLGQMGISHTDFRFSRDVTSSSYRYPFAVHMFNDGISMVDSTGFMLYDLMSNRITAKTSMDAERMARTAKGILQMAAEDLCKLGEQR